MNKAISEFRASMLRVRGLGGLHKALLSLTTSAIDASDLLRAQIVLGVSALDYYVHELTLLGMLEVYNGARSPTSAFSKFRVSMDSVWGSGASTGTSAWFENEVREQHGYLSFQQPDRIADAVRLFSDAKLWQEASSKLNMSEADVKEQLRLIVDRRNKIAHEADTDPSYPGARWPISEPDVDNALGFIERVCEAVHSTVVDAKGGMCK